LIRAYLDPRDDVTTLAVLDVLTRFSHEQQRIFDAVVTSTSHVLVLGAGGSGKSFLIRTLRTLVHNIRVCAFTGMAANNVQGRTIDSLIHDPELDMTTLDALIIDEISLCSAQKLAHLRSVGVRRLLMFGDFHQLPPVVTAFDNPALTAPTYAHQRAEALTTFSGYHPDTGALLVFEADLFTDPTIQVFML
jgi:energy-coupling factor transporter ATP-binding protein EcfA2